jgi:hypothetical protein
VQVAPIYSGARCNGIQWAEYSKAIPYLREFVLARWTIKKLRHNMFAKKAQMIDTKHPLPQHLWDVVEAWM